MSTRRPYRSRINQDGRALSIGAFHADTLPPELIAGRLRESEEDRNAIADAIADLDRDMTELESSRVVTAAVRVRMETGRLEVVSKNIKVQAALTTAGALIIRFGKSVSTFSIHASSQHPGARELYFPLVVAADSFTLECRTNADALVDLNLGSHTVDILLRF